MERQFHKRDLVGREIEFASDQNSFRLRRSTEDRRPARALTLQDCDDGERQLPGGARDSRAVCGDSPQTPAARVVVNGVQIY